ncbi:hypothetical protein ACFW2V_12290 [Streptomyces sp. NPDC058947]|uniref:hypothetical protein n=1 Tax=Streptomyces sp. NPDC058947 TaxID=3346675 RepID=UPI0036ADD1CC
MAIVAYLAVASDGSLHGEVFETDNAERFKGSFCPLADGSSGTVKEDLYRAEGGTWIKNTVILNSRRGSEVGDTSTYTSISQADARDWLKQHDYTETLSRLLA